MAWSFRRWSPFRQAQNALERGVQSEPEAVVLQQSTVWVRGITWSLMGLSAFALGWLALAQTEEIVTVPGKLEPLGVVKDVQMPVGGVVKSVLIKEGDRVKQGQVLLRLDTEASLDRQRSIRETIRHKQQQLQLKQAELGRSLDLNTTEQTMLRRSLALEGEVLQRFDVLNREGAAAELQFLQQRNKVQEVQGKLEQSAADRLRQEAILNQGLQELAGQLAELRTSLIELNVNIRYQEVRSPVDGLVFNLKPTGSGFVAQTSEPVMKIVPFDKLEARVEIPSASIGFVQVGQPVDISIDSFPASDFGVISGAVRRIGSDALPPDSLKQTYRFPADIRLVSQQLKLKSGQDLPLQVGMSLTANIKLRKVTYLQLLLSDFKNRADSLRRI
ncbi:HlyD family efflux transporter periplasmic adaptor subunit [Synechococcus sp. CS-1325]|uniref:HlyD family secretion protein n=1 Tax=unclassified Synechococcus TaxID=2626047 RepID=UPI000DB19919|nr:MULTISPECIES: HlyD family efflux transporter periplasmic adaptor subunit [unclassified Synechococcus]MCT0198807.1 HlyD family efflux transporter periplasmic adaptor subunit [Synechococcus sp. CS-1325]MCT0231430.1 HlyD family efflux transporter periplasmic adaptor subunit [Synechococcus sp. CS-1324]PZV00536.1 MAG: hemolysin D [Cyanobium sp.]PZV03245.1 MAG: hemolysin D [Cyanobium sp.]